MGYYQFRMVGRYWSRRYTYFCDPITFPSEMENSINRAAEAMTIFAVICAATFPVLHMGRPWLAYWVLPFPNHIRFTVG